MLNGPARIRTVNQGIMSLPGWLKSIDGIVGANLAQTEWGALAFMMRLLAPPAIARFLNLQSKD
jgi:hypothetical protein